MTGQGNLPYHSGLDNAHSPAPYRLSFGLVYGRLLPPVIVFDIRDTEGSPARGRYDIISGVVVMEVHLGDVVRLRKKHPCGSYEWEVVRLGADIGIRCLGCQRRVFMPRRTFEKRVKAFVSRGKGPSLEAGAHRC